MKKGKLDLELGMDRKITRRDLLQGVGVAAGAALLPTPLAAATAAASSAPYPPALTGMRGNHPGSWEVAHAVAREGVKDWGEAARTDSTDYDLVVVGAGISGLAAAHFWLQEHPDARILILDNHDDFGGHARRNEFTVDGKTLIGYGGSQTLAEPGSYPRVAKRLLKDLKVDVDRFDTAYDQDFYRRNDLASGLYFSKQAWGADTLVRYELGEMYRGYLPLGRSGLSAAEAVQQMPLPEAARRQMLELLTADDLRIPGRSEDERWEYLATITYRDFITRHFNITEAEVFRMLQDLPYDSGVGIESISAEAALFYSGLPGRLVTGLDDPPEEPYIHHFPDGNASIARLLVRKMIPASASGSSMEDIVTAPMDYSQLDKPGSPVRLRLSSTVVNVAHEGSAAAAKEVGVSYIQAGKLHRVRAKHCILACYNAMIPSLCPELPAEQQSALSEQVKVPILYTSVAVRNWQPWKKLGIGAAVAPGSYHINAKLDFPVSLGDYRYSGGPDEPAIIHMERFPHRPNEGLSRKDQYRAGRHELMATPFTDIEGSIRQQLAGMLGPAGFDPGRDIAGITVNRWAHGYSYWYSSLDDEFSWEWDWDDPRWPHVRARKALGRIAIANSDAGASAMLETAVAQAYRAVGELS